MTISLDPRSHAFRPDLADHRLSGQVAATNFVAPDIARVTAARLAMVAQPHNPTAMSSELRAGELVDVFERRDDGMAWVQNHSDAYVGYVAQSGLTSAIADPAWRVNELLAYIYQQPSIKTIPLDMISFPARVAPLNPIGEQAREWVELATGGFIARKHLVAATERVADYVFTAGRLLHVPYLWGGRTAQGVDCSGLVQMALELAGIDCPRDSDQQQAAFGTPPPSEWRDYPFTRGDLVFFAGHVGLMADGTHLLHANAHHGRVTCEPLSTVMARGGTITAIGAAETLSAAS